MEIQASTFLANQLIFKTPLFIGYSVEDTNFRQIWRIVKDRLGTLTRPSYTIRLRSSQQLKSRFARRGITVIELPGEQSDYDSILAQAFSELREFWLEMKRPITLRRLVDRICLVSVPEDLLPLYRNTVFPLAEQHGFQISLAVESLRPEDNYTAKAVAMVDGADFIVEDQLASLNLYSMARSCKKPYLRITFEGIVDQIECDSAWRPAPDFPRAEEIQGKEFVKQLEAWFRMHEAVARPALERQPQLLLAGGFYNDAVVSAINLMLFDLRRIFGRNEIERLSRTFLPELISRSQKNGLITEAEGNRMGEFADVLWEIDLHNRNVSPSEAKIIVEDALRIVSKLTAAVPCDSGKEVVRTSEAGVQLESASAVWPIPQDFQNAFDRFRAAVSLGEREEAASLISLPLKISVGGRTIILKELDEIIKRYDSIFNSQIKNLIEANDLWQNWRGIMLGRGQIWFQPNLIDGKLDFDIIMLDLEW